MIIQETSKYEVFKLAAQFATFKLSKQLHLVSSVFSK